MDAGPIHKGCSQIRGREGSGEIEPMRMGGREWLANCGRSLGKKIIATILVKCTQII